MLNLRSLRDLPKVIAILVIITCILVPSAFIVVWKTDTFHDESRRIEAEFLAQKKMALKERLQNVLALVKTKRTIMDTVGRAKIKGHVTDIHSSLSRISAEWRTEMGDADLRQLFRHNIQAFDNRNRKGQLVVLDRSGDVIYPQPDPMPIRDDIRQIRDEDGDRLIDTLIPTVFRFDDVYRTFSTTSGENGKTTEYLGYFRLFRPAEWIIAYVVDRADMEVALQAEILQILQNFRYCLTDYIFTIGANGYILSHGTQAGLIGRTRESTRMRLECPNSRNWPGTPMRWFRPAAGP